MKKAFNGSSVDWTKERISEFESKLIEISQT
jgi:hypothetical protein